jgi:hypothetical protein
MGKCKCKKCEYKKKSKCHSCCITPIPRPIPPPIPNTTYNFLLDYYWIVPPETLPAYIYNSNGQTKIINQTVWKFTIVNNNYIFGDCYGSVANKTFDNVVYTKFKIAGTITYNKQNVNINFTDSNNKTTIGLGILTLGNIDKNSFFTMQMNTGDVMHWSYMIPITSDSLFYYNLPGTNGLTLEEFLEKFN